MLSGMDLTLFRKIVDVCNGGCHVGWERDTIEVSFEDKAQPILNPTAF
jgi:hypothetical protein